MEMSIGISISALMPAMPAIALARTNGDYKFQSSRYAPFNEFGIGYEGDGRTTGNPSASSRVSGAIEIDFDTGYVSPVTAGGEPSACAGSSWLSMCQVARALRNSSERAGPRDGERTYHWIVPGQLLEVDMHYWGSNGMSPVFDFATPDIDTRIKMVIGRTGSAINVSGSVYGDAFPNADFGIADAAGHSTVLGNYQTPSGTLGPYYRLFGAGLDNQFTSFSGAVSLDADGNFAQ